MSYLTARRYGLTHVEPPEVLCESGWRQVWEHPSGMLAGRHPAAGHWVVIERSESGPWVIRDESFASSLRGAARMIERRLVQGSRAAGA